MYLSLYHICIFRICNFGKIWKLTFRRDFNLFSDIFYFFILYFIFYMFIFIEFYVITCIPSPVVGIDWATVTVHQFFCILHWSINLMRWCGKAVCACLACPTARQCQCKGNQPWHTPNQYYLSFNVAPCNVEVYIFLAYFHNISSDSCTTRNMYKIKQ